MLSLTNGCPRHQVQQGDHACRQCSRGALATAKHQLALLVHFETLLVGRERIVIPFDGRGCELKAVAMMKMGTMFVI